MERAGRLRAPHVVRGAALGMIALLVLGGCTQLKTPRIALDLPEQYNTPDGMTVDADGNVILSVPNSNDQNHPAKIVKFDADHKITEIITLPNNPETGKPCGPLGVAVGSDGNLYVADNQAFDTEEHKSRLLKITMQGGKGVKCEAVVTGFVMSNGVAAHGDCIYVCESKLDPKATPLPSGVYRFKVSELDGAKPIKLNPGGDDRYLAIRFLTRNPDWAVGANGLGFGKDGTLYVCNFGDAQLIQARLGPDGKAVSQEVLAEDQGMESADGLSIDRATGEIYIADFLGNALHKVCPKTGKVTTVARNGNTDGAGGALDRPSEPCVRGRKVYVANIDLPLAGNEYDKPHTISVIDLDE